MFAGLLAHWLAALSLQHHERVARIFPLIVGTFCDEGGFTLFWKDVSAAAGTREWVHTLADARPAQLLGRLQDEGSFLDEARGAAILQAAHPMPRPAPVRFAQKTQACSLPTRAAPHCYRRENAG